MKATLSWVSLISPDHHAGNLEVILYPCSSPAMSTGTRSFIHLLTHSVTFLSAHYVPGPELGSTNTGRPLCCVSATSVVRDGSSYQDMQWLQTGWRDRGFCSCSFKSQGQETPLSYGDTDVKKRNEPERKTLIQYTNAYIWNLDRW